MAYYISSGRVSSGILLKNNSMYVSSGGTAKGTTVNSGGRLYVSTGGTANSTTLNSNGNLYVSTGGTANSTTLNSNGNLYVSKGGTADNTTVNSKGNLNVYSGGSAESATVNFGGYLYVSSGGTAGNIVENGGYVAVADGADFTFTPHTFSGLVLDTYQSATIHSGTTVVGAVINSRGSLYVSSGGTANNPTVNSGGYLYVSSGGTAINVDWTPCVGALYVAEGAMVTYTSQPNGVYLGSGNTLLSSADVMTGKVLSNHTMYVMNYGAVENTNVNSGGNLYVASGGTAKGTTVNSWGRLYVSSGGTANSTTVNSGYLYVSRGGTADSAAIGYQGYLYVSSGGTATNITVNSYGKVFLTVAPDTYIQGTSAGSAFEVKDSYLSGYTVDTGNWLDVSSGGSADNIRVNSYAMLYISSGGSATGIIENGGYVDVADDTYVTFAPNIFSGTVLSGSNSATVHSGTTAVGITLSGSYYYYSFGDLWIDYFNFYIFSGGVAENTSVDAGGCLNVLSGGNAVAPRINSDGILYVSSGGTAASTAVNSWGRLYVSSGGTANNTTINLNGYLDVSDRGTATGITVKSGGSLYVASGGSATGITVSNGGRLYLTVAPDTLIQGTSAGSAFGVKDSFISCYTVNSGSLNVSSGGTATDITVNSNGWINIASGGSVADAIVNSGSLYASSGGTAAKTTVNAGGYLYVSSGGTASGIIENGGYVNVSAGADVTFTPNTFSGLVLGSKQSATVHSGTTAVNTTISSGGNLYVSSGGTATDIVVLEGGNLNLNVIANTYIRGTVSGFIFEMNNGVISGHTIYSGGYLTVENLGTATAVTVNSGGSLYVSSGGSATGITVSNGGRLIFAVAPDTYVQGICDDSAFEMKNAFISGYAVNAGIMQVSSGGSATDSVVNSGGSLFVSSGGAANHATVNSGGGMYVSGGGSANNITVNSRGWLYVSNSGTAVNAVVNSGGSLFVSSGGLANAILENGGFVNVADGADITFTPNVLSGFVLSAGNSATLHSGTTAMNTILSGDYDFYEDYYYYGMNFLITNYAELSVFYGGSAGNTTVDFGGRLKVLSGGSADNIEVISGGQLYVSDGGRAAHTILSGISLINSMGVSSSAAAVMYIAADGTADDMIVNSGGRLYVSNGGYAINAAVNSSGYLYVSSGGTAIDVAVNSSGCLNIYNSGTADNTTINPQGCLYVHSGGTANNTVINSRGSLYAYSGASVNKLTGQGGTVELQSGTSLTGAAGVFTLKFVSSGNYSAAGNDFSQTEFIFTSGSVVDLSGNYWGTNDAEAIYARLGVSPSQVILDDILLVDPTTTFNITATSLNHDYLGKTADSITLIFSHEIDAETLDSDAVSFVSASGKIVEITDMTVSGRQLTLIFNPLPEEGSYQLTFADSIKDITGSPLVSLRESGLDDGVGEMFRLRADFTPPHVVRISPDGDFAGTLKTFTVYFSGAVDPATFGDNIRLIPPNGAAIAPVSYNLISDSIVEFTVPDQTAYGTYQIQILPGLADYAGNCLDQNLNGVGGETSDGFSSIFAIADVDLKIRNVTLAKSVVNPGEKLAVDWEVINASGYALSGSWTDGVYLSTDTRWDVNDILLGSVSHTGGLPMNQQLDSTLDVSLSGVTAGTYYLLVRSDIYMQEKGNRESALAAQNLEAVEITVELPELEIDTPINGHVAKSGDYNVYQLRQEANESLDIVLDSLTDSQQNMELFVHFGEAPTREQFSLSLKNVTDGTLNINASETGRDLYIMVNAKNITGSLDYTLTARSVPLAITGVTPTIHGHASDATFDITGVDFTPASTVEFYDSSDNLYLPDSISFINSNRIKADFSANSLKAGQLYRVVVSNGAETAEMANAISITGASGAKFTYSLDNIPATLSPAQTFTYKFTYNNTGVDAMDAPLVILSIRSGENEGAILALNDSDVSRGFWTSSPAEGFSSSVQFLATGTTPGLLQPDPDNSRGVTVPIYYAGWRGGVNFNMQLDYYVSVINSDDATELDWNGMLDSYDLPDACKAMLAQNLSVSVGSTWGDYVKNLNSNLDYLDKLGMVILPDGSGSKNAVSINDLFSFEMMQNTGALSPLLTLQSSTDLSLVAPGVAPSVSRSYHSDLSGRFTESSFGFGWSCSWDARLEIDPSGDLRFVQGSGSRLYQPNYTNGYQTVAADGSKMTRVSGGYKLTERSGETWLFSSDGVLKSITDTNGNSVYCSYDENGSLVSLTHSCGETITITRNNDGYISALADNHGNRIAYAYDASDNLISVTDETSGASVSYAYGDSHNLTSATGIDGNSVSYSWNDMGLLSGISGRDGASEVSVSYGSFGEVTLTDNLNGSVSYFYGDNGQIAKTTDTTTGLSTYYRYDDKDQLISMFDSRGSSVGFTYDANGDLAGMTDQLGNTMKFAYDAKGSTIRMTDARGNVTEYTYDKKNNLTGTYYSNGTCESYTYDASGNLLAFTDVKGAVSSFSYDAQGRVIGETFNGKTTAYAYDGNGNVTSVTWADGTKSRYACNAFDELTLFTDANNNQTAYAYDDAGRMTSITYADNSAESFAYNTAGDLVQWTNRRGGTVDYTVDALGNTTKLTQSDGTVIEYAYDEQNRLVQSGDLAFVYNDLDYVTSITAADGREILYTYDALDRVVSTSDGVNITNYTYTVYGELDTLTSGSGALIADYDYDRYGRLAKVTGGNGTYTVYSYNDFNEVTAIEHYGKDNALTAFERYTYNSDNLITSKETADGIWSYTYDTVGQLTAAVLVKDNATVCSEAYTYDAMGNRLTSVIDGVTTTYVYNNLNQIVSANGFAYTYDADGNLLEDELRTYTWTTDNRVASETLKSTGQVWTYGYDSLGNRTSVTTNGVTTTYTVDANGNVLAEYVDGVFVRSYLQGNGLAAFTDASGNTYYYNGDLLGSTVGITNGAGAVVNAYSYDSFGNVLNATEGVANDFEFVGAYGLMKNASGTTFVRARNYDAATGRWISADPIGIEGGENLYVYCGNDGVLNIDQNGFWTFSISLDGNAGFGGGVGLSKTLTWDGTSWRPHVQTTVGGGMYVGGGAGGGISITVTNAEKAEDLAGLGGSGELHVKAGLGGSGKAVFGESYFGLGGGFGIGGEMSGNVMVTYTIDEGEFRFPWERTNNNSKRNEPMKRCGFIGNPKNRTNDHPENPSPRVTPDYIDFAIAFLLERASLSSFERNMLTHNYKLDLTHTSLYKDISKLVLGAFGFTKSYVFLNPTSLIALPAHSTIVVSVDPNDKLGNPGYGEANFIAPQTMNYTVRFENDPEWATAPARWVRVYDVLDEDFDLDTFQLDSFCLAGNLFTIGNGRDAFNQVVKITIGEDEVYVDAKINLDHETRQITAEFMAIDPETGTMLMDVTKGLLYPNDATGRGDGDIQYSVAPKEGIENGTKLTNVAEIYFDFNDPIETPVVEHTVDSVKPVLTAFTATNGDGNTVSFTFAGTDADSGISGYEIAYSADGEVFTSLSTVTESSWTCEIDLQTEYFFKARAVDNAGNVSDWSMVGDLKPSAIPPEAPAAAADPATPTNREVTVTAVFSEDSAVREYSLDGETWQEYTEGIVFTENGTVYFRGIDEAGNISEVTGYEVTNIDKVAPDKPAAAADITTPTNGKVTVTATFSNDSVVKEYSLDGQTWSEYTEAIVFTENGTVYFRGTDEAGNISEITGYEVTNIDKVAPDKPTAAADITTPTNGNVTVTATFSSDSAQKQYSLDGQTWSEYTEGIVFTENGTVYFRGTDAAGNVSEVTSYEVSNIYHVEPDATKVNLLENGVSQVVAWDAAQGKVGFMATDGNPSPSWRGVWEWPTEYNSDLGASEAELWKVVAAGKFAGSTVNHDGILLYNGIGNTFAAWTNLNDPSYGYVSLCHVDGNFQTKCLGDFDANGFDDVVIFNELGSVGIVSDAASYHDVWHVENAADNPWQLLGAGTFDPSIGQDSILFRNTANGHLYLWDNQGADLASWNWRQTDIGYLADGWEFAAIGDFKGDGIDDIVLVNHNDNDAVFVWDNGVQSTQHYVGVLGAGFKIETVGDYDADGKDDLLLREYTTGWGGIGCWSGASATAWTDFNARIETDMESKFTIVA